MKCDATAMSHVAAEYHVMAMIKSWLELAIVGWQLFQQNPAPAYNIANGGSGLPVFLDTLCQSLVHRLRKYNLANFFN
jgi:hypothetical protein